MNKKKIVVFSVLALTLVVIISLMIVNISAAPSTSVSYDIQNDWGSGSVVNVTINNTGSSEINEWTVEWTFSGDQKISQMWGASYTQNGSKVSVNNIEWNNKIASGQSVNFGFMINYSGTNNIPTDITVNSESVQTQEPTEPVNTEEPTNTEKPTNTEETLNSNEPIGWASADGGTTGGGNVSPVTVKNSSELKNHISGSDAKVIYVSGNVGGSYNVGSNKTIIGLSGAEIGSVTFKGSSNVIMRNLKLSGGEDTVSVTGSSHHLWFDHLDMRDSNDETLSIVHGSNYITVSWCKYWFTRDGSHRFGGLVGHSDDNSDEDSGKLKVTYHHNWYSEGVIERMPRVRFGQVHVFNNLFESNDTNYAIRCGVHANILSEKNVFIDQKTCFDLNNSTSDAVLQSIDDLFVGDCGGTTGKGGNAFNPPYNYTADNTSGLAENIRSGAGATLNY